MKRTLRQTLVLGAVSTGCYLTPPPALAVLPLAAGLGKQILQNMIFASVKTQLIGSLAQSGCKGAALVSLFNQAEQTALPKRWPTHPGGAKMPPAGPQSMSPPPGTAFPSPAARAMPPSGGGFLGGVMDKLRSGWGGGSPPGQTTEAASASGAGSGATSSDLKALDQGKRPGILVVSNSDPAADELMMRTQEQRIQLGLAPSRGTLTSEQMRKSAAAMGQMQEAMAHPLSRDETLGVFDELHDLGMLTDDMHTQARECILLAPDSATQAIGGTGALFKSIMLPQLVETRGRLASLSLDEQQQLAHELAQALRDAKPADRKAFREGLGGAFFPPAVQQQLRAEGALD